jgi:hypothetical protein
MRREGNLCTHPENYRYLFALKDVSSKGPMGAIRAEAEGYLQRIATYRPTYRGWFAGGSRRNAAAEVLERDRVDMWAGKMSRS